MISMMLGGMMPPAEASTTALEADQADRDEADHADQDEADQADQDEAPGETPVDEPRPEASQEEPQAGDAFQPDPGPEPEAEATEPGDPPEEMSNPLAAALAATFSSSTNTTITDQAAASSDALGSEAGSEESPHPVVDNPILARMRMKAMLAREAAAAAAGQSN